MPQNASANSHAPQVGPREPPPGVGAYHRRAPMHQSGPLSGQLLDYSSRSVALEGFHYEQILNSETSVFYFFFDHFVDLIVVGGGGRRGRDDLGEIRLIVDEGGVDRSVERHPAAI